MSAEILRRHDEAGELARLTAELRAEVTAALAGVWCESCLRRPAARSVVVDGVAFRVCSGCDLSGGAS